MHGDVIIACAGRSLPETDYQRFDCPVAAVSTAIRVIPCPDMWIVIDVPLPGSAYGDEGEIALRDPAVRTIAPQNRFDFYVQMVTANVSFIDCHRDERKHTLGFAMFALRDLGFRRLIFAGMDQNSEYAHDGIDPDPPHTERLNIRIRDYIRDFQNRFPDVELLSITPDSPINDIIASAL